MRGLYWVRNDLRTHDNLSLNAFLEECSEGVVLWTPTLSSKRAGAFRKSFLEDSLFHFKRSLEHHGQQLIIGENFILQELEALFAKYSFQKVFFSEASSVEEKKEEQLVIQFCLSHQLECSSFDQETLIKESDLPFALNQMPFIFSDFRRKVESQLVLQRPVLLNKKKNAPALSNASFTYQQKTNLLFSGGEQAALGRLTHYFWETKAIHTYKETRNGMLHENDSSRVSPWLSLGILSPRMIMHQLQNFERDHGANESSYWLLFELLWRDYLKFFSRKYQANIFREDGVKRGKHYSSIKNKDLFLRWCEGQTDEPFINANMKELNQTGWMSNRGRQNVASYLVHHLKLPWIWGAAYFEKQLIDYDSDLNWGNWLYLSGNGSDPRARIFNIKRQAEVYDPESLYQNKWNK